jgi:preprotein translocase subunit SecE
MAAHARGNGSCRFVVPGDIRAGMSSFREPGSRPRDVQGGLVFARRGAYCSAHEENEEGFHAMARTNPLQFIQQVRAEVGKVVWPTRREVVLTTIMVFIMATLTAIFFALVDLLIRQGLQGVLTIFG